MIIESINLRHDKLGYIKLENNLKNNFMSDAEKKALLMWATDNYDLKAIKLLCKYNIDIHYKNDYALRWCSTNGKNEIVKFLIEHGADVTAYNNYALRWSANNKYFSTVKILIKALPEINYEKLYNEYKKNKRFLKVLFEVFEENRKIYTFKDTKTALEFKKDFSKYINK